MSSKILTVLITLILVCSVRADIYENLNKNHKIIESDFPRLEYKEQSVELPGGVIMDFVWIPAGSFVMGSEVLSDAPKHKITISKGFWIGKYEVTQEQWFSVMGTNPSYFKGAKRPVERVSWDVCQILTKKMSIYGFGTFRLPTEAEWEYACRANTDTIYFWGDEFEEGYAWSTEYSNDQTHDVGTTLPNNWGLHDMSGNVCEWVSDWYDKRYYKVSPDTDPKGPEGPLKHRVYRGGGWYFYELGCRSAFRGFATPGYIYSNFGVRLVADCLEDGK